MDGERRRLYRYRHRRSQRGCSFQVRYRQTDLWIRAGTDLRKEARDIVISCRHQLETYIAHRPEFLESLQPIAPDPLAPKLIQQMIRAAQQTGTGPMAAVAGAIAQHVATRLHRLSDPVIVENGGDCYFHVHEDMIVGIYCGHRSPFNNRIALRLQGHRFPLAVCTSSATIGHSLSFGCADAVTVIAEDGALADAAATAIGNRVRSAEAVAEAVESARSIPALQGGLIIVEDRMAAWGELELTRP